jgi:tRNA(fMet)-specific endonuclease VapC
MPYLLDADWAIRALAGHPQATATLRQLASRRISISLITVAEIYEGAFASPNPEARLGIYRRFLAPFRVLNLNDEIAERFADVRSYLRRRGEIIPDFDLIVAATALHHDYTVLTFNAEHFRRVPDLKLYPLS